MITCPDCTPAQQYVLEQLQTRAEVTDKTALAVIMGTSNKSLSSAPRYVRVGLSCPTINAFVVVMVSFNGLPNIVMMAWVRSVNGGVVTHPRWRVKHAT